MHFSPSTPWRALVLLGSAWCLSLLARLSALITALLPRRAPGQGLVEYALVLVLVAIVVIGAVSSLGQKTSAVYGEIECTMRGGEFRTDNGNGNSARCR